jgi:hypothetical protein
MAEDLSFVREAAEQGTVFPHEWLYTREIRLMHITSIILPFYLITGNTAIAYPMASSFMILVNIGLFFFMMRYKKMNLLPITLGAIAMLMFFSMLHTGEVYPFFNIMYLNSSYSVHLASILFTLGVYLRIRTRKFNLTGGNIIMLTAAAIVAYAQGMQSDRLIISLYAPLLFAEACFLFQKYRAKIAERIIKEEQERIEQEEKERLEQEQLALQELEKAEEIAENIAEEVVAEDVVTEKIEEVADDDDDDFDEEDFVEEKKETIFTKMIARIKLIRIYKSTIFVLALFAFAYAGNSLVKRLFESGSLLTFFNIDKVLEMIPNNELFARMDYFLNNLFHALGLIGKRELFSFDGFLYFGRLFSIIALIAVIRKIWCDVDRYKDRTAPTVLFFSFVFSALIMTFVNVDTDLTSRYLFTVVIMLCVLVCVMVNHFVKNQQRAFSLVTLIVIVGVSLVARHHLPLEVNEALIEDRQRVADFVQGEGLTHGYGLLWQGKVLEEVTNGEITMFFMPSHLTAPSYRGVTLSQYNHTQDRVFLVLSTTNENNSLNDSRQREILEKGSRSEFRGGWVVYIFDENPWCTRVRW